MATVKGVMQEELSGLSPSELYELYLERVRRFGKAGKELDHRRSSNRLHVPAEEADVTHAGPDQRMIVGPELGFNINNLHVFTSGRAGGSERYHTHGDAIKYYVSGRGYELIGDERFEVGPGDFMHVPANTWHGTENPNSEPLVFLAAQQFPGTYRQVPTPFVHLHAPDSMKDHGSGPGDDLSSLEPWPLYLRYLDAQMEFGRAALELQRRRDQKRLLVKAEDAPLFDWGPGRHHIISPELGFDVYAFNLFAENLPAHTDAGTPAISGDAIRYYIEGRGVEFIGGTRVEVKAGDFSCIPAGSLHATENPYDEPMRFICWQQIPGTYLQRAVPFLDEG